VKVTRDKGGQHGTDFEKTTLGKLLTKKKFKERDKRGFSQTEGRRIGGSGKKGNPNQKLQTPNKNGSREAGKAL